VRPPRHNHQVGKAQQIEKLDFVSEQEWRTARCAIRVRFAGFEHVFGTFLGLPGAFGTHTGLRPQRLWRVRTKEDVYRAGRRVYPSLGDEHRQ
jgi:hypothetical protein